ncbi:protein kinase family protein [Roseivivax sp.]
MKDVSFIGDPQNGDDARMLRILSAAERHFGTPVREVEAPPGPLPSRLLLIFDDRRVIATARPAGEHADIESRLLEALAEVTDRAPRSLGVTDGVLFQSDLGPDRLDGIIGSVPPGREALLAEEAVRALSELHAAAGEIALDEILPPPETGPELAARRLRAVEVLAAHGGTGRFDMEAATAVLAEPGHALVKGDCRPVSATLGPDGRLRWFDFETAVIGQAAADYASLLSDPAWRLPPDRLFAMVAGLVAWEDADFLDHLALHLVVQAAARLRFLESAAQRAGRGASGAEAETAARLSEVGAHAAGQSALTQPLATGFKRAARHHRKRLREAGQRLGPRRAER